MYTLKIHLYLTEPLIAQCLFVKKYDTDLNFGVYEGWQQGGMRGPYRIGRP